MARAVIFANGNLPEPVKARKLLNADDLILCADGGLLHAREVGVTPRAVIGDMDSLSRDVLNELSQSDVPIQLFPSDKDKTDLELALEHAVELQVREILIVAALGKRMDHSLSNIQLLMMDILDGLEVRIDDGVEEIFVCKDERVIHGNQGDIISLLPWNGLAGGIRTEGLKWPLVNETLFPEGSRGISNIMLTERAIVSVAFGVLLVVHERL
ncbi:MAG: thiamine diphosphokinase [Chloroflexi bacterium RBG_16_51_16]|nr:MAG: thiamine diphosphokinase [Chloroflexi bacterium RBG_16_51_16]